MTIWSVVRFLHVLAAIGWVGGQLTLSAVVVPAVKAQVDAGPKRVELMRDTGRRFARLANLGLLPGLVVSGLALAGHRRIDFSDLGASTYGRLFAAKLILVAASISLAAAHGVLAGRRRASRPLAMAGLGAAVGIVLFASALVA